MAFLVYCRVIIDYVLSINLKLIMMDFFLMLWQLFVLVAIVLLPIYCFYKLGKASIDSDRKLLWCLIILLIPVLGSLAYLLVGTKYKQVSQL